MAHEIDQTTGKAAIAYAGEKPWHGLGQDVDPSADLDTWIKEAKFDWELVRTPVLYQTGYEGKEEDFETHTLPRRDVLYRSDTKAPISVVSDRYKIVQPQEVAEFFREFVEAGGYQMETMGVLRGGERYWAMAKMSEGFKLGKDDPVNPYVLLATSADGSMATVAHLTSVRVVCQNTLQLSVGGSGKKAAIQIPHVQHFNPDTVKEELGLLPEWWEEYSKLSKQLSKRKVTKEEAVRFFLDVFAPRHAEVPDDDLAGLLEDDWELDPADKDDDGMVSIARVRPKVTTLVDIYENGVGQDTKSAKGTAWGLVNAVTRYWDHEYPARSQDNRLTWSWFGGGSREKQRALDLAADLAETK